MYIEGVECGRLSLNCRGIMYELSAVCSVKNKIVHLSVFGDGKSAPIGVMQPCDEGLCLHRKLTRLQMQSLPAHIEYAADCAKEVETEQAEQNNCNSIWYSMPDGTLTRFDGRQWFVAMPSQMRTHQRLCRLICGRQYVIFPGKSIKTMEIYKKV